MNVFPRSVPSLARCATALADAAWFQSRAARRTFTCAVARRAGASAATTATASPSGSAITSSPHSTAAYTAYSLPSGAALPTAAPRNLEPEQHDAAVTLEAPRRRAAQVQGRTEVQESGSQIQGHLQPSQQQYSRPQQQQQKQQLQQPQPQQEQPSQQSRQSQQQLHTPSAAGSSTQSASTTPKPPQPRRTLRPRKAAITLTPAAVSQLRALLDDPEPRMIRVGVRNRGCSGLAYHLEYVGEADRGRLDEEVVQDGVRVLVEGRALMSVIGSEMDWAEDRLSARFVFRNPNIKESCGCGESFMV